MFEVMLQDEMTSDLGYENNARNSKNTTNRRNGYSKKTVVTTNGNISINVLRDHEATFEHKIIPKGCKDVSGIKDKVLSMYAKCISQRDIASTIEDIYGFEILHETISEITDSVLEYLEQWENTPLKKFYPFLFVDCLYVNVYKDYEVKNCAVYTILGYDTDGMKDLFGFWINETESAHVGMQIFDQIKSRGVEDILFISVDGVKGLEEGEKLMFKDVIVQRCIVHLIRNSIKYVPSKEYRPFTE